MLCDYSALDKTSRRKNGTKLGKGVQEELAANTTQLSFVFAVSSFSFIFSWTLPVSPAFKSKPITFHSGPLPPLITGLDVRCHCAGRELTGLLSFCFEEVWGLGLLFFPPLLLLIKAFSRLFLKPSPNTKLSLSPAPSNCRIPTSNLCNN